MRVLACAAAVAVACAAATAQDPDMQKRMRALEESNERMQRQLQELTGGRTAAPIDAKAQKQDVPPTAQESVEWKEITRSGDVIKFYGFFRADIYYDTARANHVIIPAWVLPENGIAAKDDDNQFAIDPRLTRFGFDVDAGSIGDAKIGGKLETDFANFPTGSPESRATPRIRLAYMNIDFDDWHFRIGQDWDVISPLFPSVNGELLMWNAGNTGDRRAQVQVGWDAAKGEESSLHVRASLGLTGAIDNQDLDTPTGERDGFDSGIPHGQMRIGWTRASWVEKQKITAGLWGAIGRQETDTRFNGESRFTSSIVGLDLTLPISDTLQFRTEHWVGQTLGDFRGGVGQSINTTTGEEIHSHGGWAELVWDASKTLRLVGGGSYDDPRNSEVAAGGRRLNWTGYVATIMNWGSGLKTGFEAIYWETDWGATALGNMVRLNAYAQLDW